MSCSTVTEARPVRAAKVAALAAIHAMRKPSKQLCEAVKPSKQTLNAVKPSKQVRNAIKPLVNNPQEQCSLYWRWNQDQ